MRDEIIIGLLDQVHPDVPKFALGTMPRIHPSWAHPIGLLNIWKLQDPRYIPEGFKDYVCFGSRDSDTLLHSGFSTKRRSPVCKRCERPFVYMFFYCISCGKPFIRDFDDTRFCNYYPHCYPCLPKTGWDFCKDHVLPVRLRAFQITGETTKFKPNGLSPKQYTEKEIADAFAFLNE
jgi:hypothetical protein